jgi:hypothetical protein
MTDGPGPDSAIGGPPDAPRSGSAWRAASAPVDVRSGARDDHRNDYAVGRHLGVDHVLLEEDPPRLMAAEPSLRVSITTRNGVDGHDGR